MCPFIKYGLKNIGDVEMYISPISSYRSNPQNLQTFTGLNLRKGLLYSMLGLSLLGVATSKVVAQTASAAKPKMIYHAVDSVSLGGGKSVKLYVAGSDSTTFNRIFGFLFNPSAELSGKSKRAVDVLIYDPKTKLITYIPRDDARAGMDIAPPPKILAYLEGKGKNQSGKTVTMASDCNIVIGRDSTLDSTP
jgi:hypothetical protein